MTETIEHKIENLDERNRALLHAAIGERPLTEFARGRITSWSLIPFKGGTLIGDVVEHTDPKLVKADMQTSTVLFIDRREDGFAVTRNTIYDLDGAEVTVGQR